MRVGDRPAGGVCRLGEATDDIVRVGDRRVGVRRPRAPIQGVIAERCRLPLPVRVAREIPRQVIVPSELTVPVPQVFQPPMARSKKYRSAFVPGAASVTLGKLAILLGRARLAPATLRERGLGRPATPAERLGGPQRDFSDGGLWGLLSRYGARSTRSAKGRLRPVTVSVAVLLASSTSRYASTK